MNGWPNFSYHISKWCDLHGLGLDTRTISFRVTFKTDVIFFKTDVTPHIVVVYILCFPCTAHFVYLSTSTLLSVELYIPISSLQKIKLHSSSAAYSQLPFIILRLSKSSTSEPHHQQVHHSPPKMPAPTLGRILLTLCGLFVGLSPYIADFNETHVLNPRWPPHARFHNGQTMSMGAALGLATLYYTWRDASQGRGGEAKAAEADSLLTAAIFGSLYWITGLSAIFYPGSAGTDPEFGEGFAQGWLFAGALLLDCIGGWVAVRGVNGKGKVA